MIDARGRHWYWRRARDAGLNGHRGRTRPAPRDGVAAALCCAALARQRRAVHSKELRSNAARRARCTWPSGAGLEGRGDRWNHLLPDGRQEQ